VPNVFSPRTLGEFEDAAASIPLRQLDRAFAGAGIQKGDDPGSGGGDRRTQFRRYIAGVDQHDPQQSTRLGNALGALIAEVAASKQDFLVTAAERDGFAFTDGVFRPAETAPRSFAVTRVEDFALIDDRGRRLQLLANDRPKDAVDGARELVDSVCRTVLRLTGKPAPGKTADLVDIAEATLKALEPAAAGDGAAKKDAGLIGPCLAQLGAVVARVGELQRLSPRHARLAAGVAVTIAGFVAETYVQQTG
jgi:hypothetical protein